MMNGILNLTDAARDDIEIEGSLTDVDWTRFSSSSSGGS
jgi:hypothetical protein